MQGASQAASRSGFGGAFLHGLLATLLATACTAPVMGAALSATIGQPAWFTYAVLAALSLGMSSPYLLLALRPQWLRFLPRAGAWMESMKQFMGFLLLATVIWLLWVYAGLTGEDAVYGLLLGLLIIAAALWFIGVARPAARTTGGKRFTVLMFVALLAASGGVLWRMADLGGNGDAPAVGFASRGGNSMNAPVLPESSLGADGKIQWQSWSPALVEQAVAEGRVVFVDFTARWCTNCLANEKLVLDTAPIRAVFGKHKVLAIRADWTRRDAETRAAINAYGRVGIPLNVIYGPGLENGKPEILPEILTQEDVQETLARAAGAPKGSAAL